MIRLEGKIFRDKSEEWVMHECSAQKEICYTTTFSDDGGRAVRSDENV